MESERPEIFVLGGPNGAGKTTVAELLMPDTLGVSNFVNADLIAKALSPHTPEASAFVAGRHMLSRLGELRSRQATFGFETTLASKTFARFLREAQARGYLVHIVYIGLSNPDLAVHRVRLRVERGGHDIPESTIRRRYVRSLANLFQLYLPLADGWSMWDNSSEALVSVAHGRAGSAPTILDAVRWERAKRQGTTDDS